ncbi:ATP synthase F1 subunit gamma [Candidatus Berkelbacteria bacterium CG_4_9_14_3_um_filter_39_23]|uniref:ATP synthase gamma chain n=2 Tax=Candidatus Berkelbacteria TaxID=1618330 RepID=A0A2M7CI19_9BACT|nr:MAG: ATP synthase F1 subunit gamma [Candidatus Berkelbacteria bacterium CG03_land_8_20_14_0_80_40_36]PIX30517.1 MAG: ATP synthase F1 subunit gamma [Candidatus Berkelbacteria bacterium CG_4_8_14_3_um_filter_39_27]PJB51643.1 MAG: ATP synthase F1 subunit gamma [Candidatus Berkelbacteria bacterium CG_4_9_14_3_um_filter_39_23]
MPNTQIIRRRIKSIKNITQITKAMEMVAVSKMKKAEEKTAKSKKYAELASEIAVILKLAGANSHRYVKNFHIITKELIIIITSNKGLCGSFNVAILKKIVDYMGTRQDRQFEIITIGKKGNRFLQSRGFPVIADFEISDNPVSGDIAPILQLVDQKFSASDCQKISVAFTEFVSTLKQIPTISGLLPFEKQVAESQDIPESEKNLEYLFEPAKSQILKAILPKIMQIKLFQYILESIASEHSSRMMAMQNASKSGKEIVTKLNLLYNSIRQSAITQEIAEITAGAENLN